jgi:hypothetical protein
MVTAKATPQEVEASYQPLDLPRVAGRVFT